MRTVVGRRPLRELVPPYADYYMESVQNYRRPPTDPRNYIIDKYYYRNPNIRLKR